MIRAVIFDFYSVIVPDVFEAFEKKVLEEDEDASSKIKKQVDNYYMGLSTFEYLIGALEYISGNEEELTKYFRLTDSDIPPIFIEIVKALHLHFMKVGILGNMGEQEIDLLTKFNEQYQEFDLISGPATYGEPLLSEAFFKAALRDLGEPPQTCLLISGHQEYLNFAKQINMQTYGFVSFDDISRHLKEVVKTSS